MAGAGRAGGGGSGRGEGWGRAIWTQVAAPAVDVGGLPGLQAWRAIWGLTVQACWTREDPSSPHMPPMTLVAVSMMRCVPASSQTGCG